MNNDARLERIFSDALAESAPSRAPDRLRADIQHVVSQTRPRPRWLATLREAPMHTLSTATVGSSTARRSTAIPLRMVWLVLIVLLVLAMAAGGLIVGSRLFQTSGVPIPQGGAAILAYDSNGDIFTVRADGTDVRQLTAGPSVDMTPSWSPDGTRLAYRGRQAGTDSIVIMDPGGGNVVTVASADQGASDCHPWDLPTWSPDSTTLIYPASAQRVGPAAGPCDGFDLFVVAADGSSPATRLLSVPMNATAPAWSPDGTRIALAGLEPSGDAGVYVADVGKDGVLSGGLEPRLVTRVSADQPQLVWLAPRWSPDGKRLAAAAGSDASCIAYASGTLDAFIVEADGSGRSPLAATTSKEYNPTWSPDGTHLAFQRIVDASEWVHGRPCTMATWVIDADGTNERRLEGLGTDDSQPPYWSPDGTRLVGNVVRVVDGIEHYDIIVVTADDSSPLVTIQDAGSASWQPLAAPLPLAPSLSGGPPAP